MQERKRYGEAEMGWLCHRVIVGCTLAVRCFAILPRQMVVFVLIPGCSSLWVFARYFNRSPLMFLSFNCHQLDTRDQDLGYNHENSANCLFSYHWHNIGEPRYLHSAPIHKDTKVNDIDKINHRRGISPPKRHSSKPNISPKSPKRNTNWTDFKAIPGVIPYLETPSH